MENHMKDVEETAAMPCGFLKYTCEKQPKITYMNAKMRELLRIPPDCGCDPEELEFYGENIFLLIPMEERRRFARHLSSLSVQSAPVAGEIAILRYDGTKAYLFGWVAKCLNEQGEEEFQSACMDVTERHREEAAAETERYLKALADVYDKIFEYDFVNHTVKFLYGMNTPEFQKLKDIPVQMEEATARWIQDTVLEEERKNVQAFFQTYYKKRLEKTDSEPMQIRYRALSSDGNWKNYTGIFLKIDRERSLFCCRNVPDAEEAHLLRNENAALKKNLQDLVMHFTDGIAAFEIQGEMVTPLYASENVCGFFGFTRDEWLERMKKSSVIREFVSRSQASYRDFAKLLENGEAEFTYFDLHTGTRRRIRAICSQKLPAAASPRYVMLYNVEPKEETEARRGLETSRVFIRTFGYFDVFVGEKPIAFRNKKSKELFALLVDRRGGYVSSEEAISFLWEDEPVNSVTLARYRKVALRLKNILEEYGISEVVESVDGKRRIATDKVRCDLYDYLSGKEESAQLFKGSYLTNYSWGENTLAELAGDWVN